MTQDQPADDPELTSPVARPVDEPTHALHADSPTTTGPTVGSWPADQREPDLPRELVWQSAPHPSYSDTGLRETRSVGYYVSLAAAVLAVLALVATLTVLTLNRPVREVVGVPAATGPLVPTVATTTEPASEAAPPATAPTALDELAEHPLSTASAAMPPSTCSLPRFDPADDAQATFYAASKVCADAAWGALLPDTEIGAVDVAVVTVAGTPAATPCGEVAPDAPATQCAGTVYMTPAHLRDGEGNDRYPGRYFGVFLREYAEAVQDRSGLTATYTEAKEDPDASAVELDRRLARQATCLAGVAAGAMANRGAVDTNIVNEIRDRLTAVDAPPDASTWYDKGFRSRQPVSCNTWLP